MNSLEQHSTSTRKRFEIIASPPLLNKTRRASKVLGDVKEIFEQMEIREGRLVVGYNQRVDESLTLGVRTAVSCFLVARWVREKEGQLVGV